MDDLVTPDGDPVSVRWHPSDVPDPLLAHLRERFEEVRTGRLCPHCGSSEHGAPWATGDGRPIHVSLARSGPHALTAVADRPVGLDVERVDAVRADWRPELVLAPGESGAPARTWAAKEAVLKLLGVGLARPMTTVLLAEYTLVDLPAPAGYVAVVATGGPEVPRRAPRRRTGR